MRSAYHSAAHLGSGVGLGLGLGFGFRLGLGLGFGFGLGFGLGLVRAGQVHRTEALVGIVDA